MSRPGDGDNGENDDDDDDENGVGDDNEVLQDEELERIEQEILDELNQF